jgi:hypothetical protein
MYDDDEQDNTEDRSLDESSNSNYSEEYDYLLVPVNVPQLSAKGLQENILDKNDDVQSRLNFTKNYIN